MPCRPGASPRGGKGRRRGRRRPWRRRKRSWSSGRAGGGTGGWRGQGRVGTEPGTKSNERGKSWVGEAFGKTTGKVCGLSERRERAAVGQMTTGDGDRRRGSTPRGCLQRGLAVVSRGRATQPLCSDSVGLWGGALQPPTGRCSCSAERMDHPEGTHARSTRSWEISYLEAQCVIGVN